MRNEPDLQLEPAVRRAARTRLLLSGVSGSGKTLSALRLAAGLGGPIAVIDTERGSASLYADPVTLPSGRVVTVPPFQTVQLGAPYSPERYVRAIHMCEAAGANVIVIDSITHEWDGIGGCLELVDDIAKARYKGNSWSAWSEVTPRHRALIDAILQSPAHVIVTVRSKMETAQQEVNGRKQVVKLGMKANQREGLEYEFTVAFDLSHPDNFAVASKDRTGMFMARDPRVIDESMGAALAAWLNGGAPAPAPSPAPAAIGAAQDAPHDATGDAGDAGDDMESPFDVAAFLAKARTRLAALGATDGITALVEEVTETLAKRVPPGLGDDDLAEFKRDARSRWHQLSRRAA